MVYALLYNTVHLPVSGESERNHNFMLEKKFLYCTDSITGYYCISCLHRRCKLPFLVWNRIQVYSSLKEESTLLSQRRKRILETIKDLCQQSWSQLNGKKLPCELHRVSNLYS